jgi:hypothetical protein
VACQLPIDGSVTKACLRAQSRLGSRPMVAQVNVPGLEREKLR